MAAAWCAHRAPMWVEETFARGAYPRIASAVGAPARAYHRLLGAVDFDAPRPSLAEIGVLLTIAMTLILLVRAWRRGFGALLRRALVLVGCSYGVFLLLWGGLYARAPLSGTLGLTVEPVAAEELHRIASSLAVQLDVEIASAESEPVGAGALAEHVRSAWGKAIADEPRLGFQRHPVLAVPVASRALTASGISGIFSPFTQECHVAVGLVRADRGFVACHEIAHAQGWAREDEANYLAWRVASRSDDAELRVSAHAVALLHVLRALKRADPALYAEQAEQLSPDILALFEERSTFWVGARVEAATRIATRANDSYLRSQGQAGVASYGRMVDLLAAEFRRERW